VFDPFYTTKPTGTGLGLMAVKVHAAEWGGAISVHKSPLGGARFRIVVPPVMGGKLAEDEEQPEAVATP
jgi:two-component system C4-dicarboxylate transport sensor histidine kinase DctB